MIKTLSYISKINKSLKEMKKLYEEPMKSLKISFEEENYNIKYQNYYFNGIQMPKDIEIKDIETNSFKLYWKMDDIDIINVDKKEIKFRVEMRKDNEKFIQVYEGNDNNCLISKLNKNTNYEIKICSIYKNIISSWTEIHKIKTLLLDSVILRDSNKENYYFNKINEWINFNNLELIYRGSRDGTTADIFHKKCDNQGPTLCLYKNNKNNIFGGYSSISWTSAKGKYYSAPESFLFTLSNIYNIEPTKFPNSDSNSVYHYYDYGPSFGGGVDIIIYQDFKNSNSNSGFPSSYQDVLGKGKSIFTGDLNNNNSDFKVEEIEVFKVLK